MNLFKKLTNTYKMHVAVKEAMDGLPSAVCYFTKSGFIRLCNAAMYDLYREMTNRELQSYDELVTALNACDETTKIIRDGNIFLFPNGRVWLFSEKEIKTSKNRIYTEIVFNDVTEVYEKRRELEQQSVELKSMYKDLKQLSENTLEVIREQEILNMKSRLHDQMNMGVVAIRQILRQEITTEENAEAVAKFRFATQILREENAMPQDDLTDFIKDAAVAGVHVEINGDLPDDIEEMHLLVSIFREACVNAARHGNATKLFITSELKEDSRCIQITNDGKTSEAEVAPRGGLLDIENEVIKMGGNIKIEAQPIFKLTIVLPVKK